MDGRWLTLRYVALVFDLHSCSTAVLPGSIQKPSMIYFAGTVRSGPHGIKPPSTANYPYSIRTLIN